MEQTLVIYVQNNVIKKTLLRYLKLYVFHCWFKMEFLYFVHFYSNYYETKPNLLQVTCSDKETSKHIMIFKQ